MLIKKRDRGQRGGLGPNSAVWPMGTPDECLPDGLVIDKRYHMRGWSSRARSLPAAGELGEVAPGGLERALVTT